MRPSPLLLVLPSALSLAACLAPAEPTDPDPPAAAVDDGGMCEAEDVGEACDAITACHVACYALLTLGCGGVGLLCAAGEPVTAGGITWPCLTALSITCAIGGESCSTYCGAP